MISEIWKINKCHLRLNMATGKQLLFREQLAIAIRIHSYTHVYYVCAIIMGSPRFHMDDVSFFVTSVSACVCFA